MNYVRHLNAFFSFIRSDERLTCSHVSLYLALFQYWNFNRFQNPFPVYRDNLMKQSKIGSKNTYHKCIKELHESKYIFYHPTTSKFLPVRISVIRLDVQEEQPTRYKQLDLFGEEISASPCPNNGTDSVPLLSPMSTDFDTGTVPKMGHNIKHKHFNKTESKQPSQIIFDKNEKLSQEINSLAGVPNPVHQPSSITEVEAFFLQHNYPDTEAKKFFNHYKAIGWKIKGVTPIEDWQAAAHKWMLNTSKYEPVKLGKEDSPTKDIQYLLERFLEGQQVFKFILPEHFTELNLKLTKETMQQAWHERINQLSGTNQHSLNQVWDAYLQGNENNELVAKDKPNLLDLAKRIAVLKHFQTQKP